MPLRVPALYVVVCTTAATLALLIRANNYCRERIIWSSHVLVHRRQQTLKKTYRMNEQSLIILLPYWVRPARGWPHVHSKNRRVSDIILHCTLHWLTGGSYLDISDVGRISTTSFFRCMYKAFVRSSTAKSLTFGFLDHQLKLIGCCWICQMQCSKCFWRLCCMHRLNVCQNQNLKF